MNNFQDQLEKIKMLFHYSVHCFYGEATGTDDFDIPSLERRISVYGVPVGVLGGARTAWITKSLDEFLKMDIAQIPKLLPNPPTASQLRVPGRYVWGVEDEIEQLRIKGYFTPEGYQFKN